MFKNVKIHRKSWSVLSNLILIIIAHRFPLPADTMTRRRGNKISKASFTSPKMVKKFPNLLISPHIKLTRKLFLIPLNGNEACGGHGGDGILTVHVHMLQALQRVAGETNSSKDVE